MQLGTPAADSMDIAAAPAWLQPIIASGAGRDANLLLLQFRALSRRSSCTRAVAGNSRIIHTMKLSIALLASGAAALAPNVQRATQLASAVPKAPIAAAAAPSSPPRRVRCCAGRGPQLRRPHPARRRPHAPADRRHRGHSRIHDDRRRPGEPQEPGLGERHGAASPARTVDPNDPTAAAAAPRRRPSPAWPRLSEAHRAIGFFRLKSGFHRRRHLRFVVLIGQNIRLNIAVRYQSRRIAAY